jgi:membrane fusion protein (multidrug efflux system)
MPDLYVVASGLTENDQILLEGVQKVKDNDKIQPIFVAPKEAIARLKLYSE